MTEPTMVIYHYRDRFPTDAEGWAMHARLQAQHPGTEVRVVAGYDRVDIETGEEGQ